MPYAAKEEHNIAQRIRRNRRVANGFCRYCNEKAIDGQTRCAKHAYNENRDHLRYRERLISKGLCPKCAKPSHEDGKRCVNCLEQDKDYRFWKGLV